MAMYDLNSGHKGLTKMVLEDRYRNPKGSWEIVLVPPKSTGFGIYLFKALLGVLHQVNAPCNPRKSTSNLVSITRGQPTVNKFLNKVTVPG
jgi:hypothetical protein